MEKKIVKCLYEYFKNSPKKLKIVCDWDEVIQAHEPYAFWRVKLPMFRTVGKDGSFEDRNFWEFFDKFWKGEMSSKEFPFVPQDSQEFIEYFPYGSKIKAGDESFLKEQQEFKNSSDFYEQAPFLKIAKCLVKLIKAGKVEEIIFLSAYDKRKFPDGDDRKYKIFKESFARLANDWEVKYDDFEKVKGGKTKDYTFVNKAVLQLISFDNEEEGNSKSHWALENVPDLNVFIDDNPIICGNVEATTDLEDEDRIIVCSPHYPIIETQHINENVLLIENSVIDIGLDYFSSNYEKEDDEDEFDEEDEEEKRPFGVCLECRQKKTVFQKYKDKEMCSDCRKTKPAEIRPLSPAFMDEDELEVFNKLSEKEQQEHFEGVRKFGKEKIGDCVQCKNKGVLIIDYVKHDLCVACFKWQMRVMGNGIASSDAYLKQLEEEPHCRACDNRSALTRFSTRELMREILERGDFEDITTWEDDGFLSRFKEIIAELKETEDFEKRRQREVNDDIGRKHSKRKKYSRRT